MQLENNVAIVSGGASGMGVETAKTLLAAGAKVTLLDINEQAVKDQAETLGCQGIVCDVTSADAVAAAIAQARESYGPARICVCCAGVAPAKRVVGREGAMPLEAFEQVININLIGTFNVLRVAAADMTSLDPVNSSGERGIIISTASVAAYEGQIGQAAYSASKGGVVAMTLPIARELAKFGVRIMTIAPGLIATPMLLGMPQEVQDSLAQSVPFPKRLGEASEYARLTLHIIENEMLNGSVIRLDGAIRMQPK